MLDVRNIKHPNVLKLVDFPNTQQIIDHLRVKVKLIFFPTTSWLRLKPLTLIKEFLELTTHARAVSHGQSSFTFNGSFVKMAFRLSH